MANDGASSDGGQLGELNHSLVTWMAMITNRLDASDAMITNRLDASNAMITNRLDASNAMITNRLDASDAALAALTQQMANCMDRLAGVEERYVWYQQLAEEDQDSKAHA